MCGKLVGVFIVGGMWGVGCFWIYDCYLYIGVNCFDCSCIVYCFCIDYYYMLF